MSDEERDRVLSILEDRRAVEFTGDTLRELIGPVVYILFRGDQPLYVGVSSYGVGRFTPRHPALQPFDDTDRLQVWPMPDLATAQLLESLLITRLRPVRNRRQLIGYRPLQRYLGVSDRRARILVHRLSDHVPASSEIDNR